MEIVVKRQEFRGECLHGADKLATGSSEVRSGVRALLDDWPPVHRYYP